jgi:PAS domain
MRQISQILAPDAELPCGDARLATLYRHWRSIHPSGGGLPGRRHFDPLDVARLLPWIWLIDVARQPLRFRYRLLGTRQVAALGGEATGRWIDERYADFRSSATYPLFVAAAEEGAASYHRGPPDLILAQICLMSEQLLLPLAGDGRRVDMLLAITVYQPEEPGGAFAPLLGIRRD